jgi:signal transduction histidine kinase
MNPVFRSNSLKTRILKWMTLIALGPLVLVAYQGYHCGRKAVIQSQKEHIRSVVLGRKQTLIEWLEQRKKEINILSLMPQLCQLCSKGMMDSESDSQHCNLMNFVREGDEAYRDIIVYDLNWREVLRSERSGSNAGSLQIPEDWKQHLSEHPAVLQTLFRKEDHAEIDLLIGKTIDTSENQAAGFIIASLNLSATLKPILEDRTGLGKTGKLYLVSSEGRYEYPPSVSESIFGQKAEIPPEILSGEGKAVLEYRDFRDKIVVGSSTAIGELGAIVVAEIDRDEAFAWLNILKNRMLATAAITFFIVIILSLKIASHLSKPLRELAKVSRNIAQGHQEERVGHLEGLEAQEVATAFNAMLDEVESAHKRIVHSSALAAVGELSSSIVHEMRNPLSTVKINLQALRKKVEQDETHRELAEIALTQVLRLEKMASDLLGYGKPLEIHPEPVTLSSVAKDLLAIFQKELEEKSLSIKIRDQSGEARFMADPEQIRRCLTNLISNAIQASPKGGEIILTFQILPEKPERISISVMDNGAGIPESYQNRLFQPFFTTHETGTGLGLANVKKIVEYHQGTVSASNRAEGGAVFTIILPLRGSIS